MEIPSPETAANAELREWLASLQPERASLTPEEMMEVDAMSTPPDAPPDVPPVPPSDPPPEPEEDNPGDWACPECNAVFRTEMQLRGHKMHHSYPHRPSDHMVTCPYCEQQFKEKGLNIHLPVCPRNPNPGKTRRGRSPGRRRHVEVALQPGAVTDDQLLEIIASISGSGASVPLVAIGRVYAWVSSTQDLLEFIRDASQ